jgi:hypothetical protein
MTSSTAGTNCKSPMMPIVNASPVMSNACLNRTASISAMPVVDSALEVR